MEDYDTQVISSTISVEDFKNLLSLKDNNSQTADNDVLGSYSKNKTIEEKRNYLEKLKRTPEWLAAASRTLLPYIESLKKLIGHDNQSIRLELAKMICSLVQKCLIHMKSCTTPLFEMIIALSQDNEKTISKICHKIIQKHIITNHQEHGLDVIEEIFNVHLLRLPRIIYTGQDDEKISALLLLKGLVEILHDTKLKILLSNIDILDTFILILMACAEMLRTNELLQDEHSIRTVDMTDDKSVQLKRPWKQFKHLSSIKEQQILFEICQCICQSNACEIVVNYLLDLLNKANQSCNEVMVILQLILQNCKNKMYLMNYFDEFLASVHWKLAIQPSQLNDEQKQNDGKTTLYEDRTEGLYESALSIRYTDICYNNNDENGKEMMVDDESVITISDAKFNVLYTCLLLESIGVYGMVLEKDFQPFVLKTLYQILDKTGTGIIFISFLYVN